MAANKPDLREIVVPSTRDLWGTYPSSGLTPQKLARIFKEADAGNVYRQMELFSEMEEKDSRLAANLQTRRLAVASLPWNVTPASDDKRDKEIAEFVQANLENIPDLRDDFSDILDGIGKGFSITEILWEIRDGKVWIQDLKWRHQRRFTFLPKDYTKPEAIVTGIPRLLSSDFSSVGEELPPNKFIVFTSRARSGFANRGGLLRSVAWLYLFKNYDLKHWVTFAEIFGIPFRLGKYPTGATAEDKEALLKAVINIGQDTAGIIPDTATIEFIEAQKNSSTGVYEALANFCNREMSIAILGHPGSSEATPGRLGGEDNAENVRRDLLKADASALANAIRWQLVKPLVDFNFGPQDGYPGFEFDTSPPLNLKEEAQRDKILVADIGIPVSKRFIYEKYNLAPPEDDKDTLQVAPASSPFGLSSLYALRDKRRAEIEAEEQQRMIDRFFTVKKKVRSGRTSE